MRTKYFMGGLAPMELWDTSALLRGHVALRLFEKLLLFEGRHIYHTRKSGPLLILEFFPRFPFLFRKHIYISSRPSRYEFLLNPGR